VHQGGVPTLEMAASATAFLPSSHLWRLMGFVAWCSAGTGAALQLLRDHSGDCCGPGPLGCFLQALKAMFGGNHFE